MNVAFRVDVSLAIGTGHFMRCLTLANALAERGARCCFLCRRLPPYLAQLLAQHGHALRSLPAGEGEVASNDPPHAAWLEGSQASDAHASVAVLGGLRWDWLVVDHYALDWRWESELRRLGVRILAIDDLADRRHECDLLLDQNLYGDMHARYAEMVPPDCRLLLGPRFALLREEFRRLRSQVEPRQGAVQRILIFFGGIDAQNFTARAVEALAGVGRRGLEVHVVLGAQHPQRVSIEALCLRRGYHCHVQTPRMAELMAAADMAIGAGGMATWERCALGVPALALSTANNQMRQLVDAASHGLVYAPDAGKDVQATITRHMGALMENSALRRLISSAGLAAVDGRGVQRVVARMGCTGIEMRVAQPDDSERLHRWRNHPDVRAVSRCTDPIPWEDHCRWFSSVLDNPRRKLLIGVQGGEPIGVVRFDVDADRAEVSIYLAPEKPLRGRGGDLLQSAEDWLVEHCPEVKSLHAHAKGSNAPSKALFVAGGYDIDNILFTKRLHGI